MNALRHSSKLVVLVCISGLMTACDGGAQNDTYAAASGVTVVSLRGSKGSASRDPQPSSGEPVSYGQPSAQGQGNLSAQQDLAAAPSPPAQPLDPEAALLSRATPGALSALAANGGSQVPVVIANVSPQSGPASGGNEILITGSGFANVQVLIGGDVAQVTSQSSNAVTVIAPDGNTGVVTVVVTNREGTYAVAPAAYAYRG
jgi:IPT/TIG domain